MADERRRLRCELLELLDLADIGFVVDDEDIGRHHECSLAVAWMSGDAALTFATLSAEIRNRTQAPRSPPGASNSSIPPPCSSRMRPTMARPRPVPFSRV